MTDFPALIQPRGRGEAGTAHPPVALRSALVDAISRRRRRLRFRAAVVGGVCLAIAAAVLSGGVLSSGPEPVLAIDDGNEWVTVRILDGEAGAAEMTRELQEAGIDGEVHLVPAVPGFVGHWVGLAMGPEPPHRPCDLPEDAPDDTICVNPPLMAGGDVSFEGDAFQIRRDAIYKLAEMPTIFYVGRVPEGSETPLDSAPRTPGMDVFPFERTFIPLRSANP
jgi:hypothetical protein